VRHPATAAQQHQPAQPPEPPLTSPGKPEPTRFQDHFLVRRSKVGAAILAQLLRADLLPGAWIAPPAVRQLRALLRHRAQLVRLRTLLRNRIHAVLADHGHDRPADCWSGPGREWLASLELPAVSAEVISDALALIDALESVTGRLDAEVRQHARSGQLGQSPDPAVRGRPVHRAGPAGRDRRHHPVRLRAQAGVLGRAHPDRARLGPHRPARAHPGQGSVCVRWILCEAAQKAKHSPQFAASYQSIARRRGTKIATPTIARQLLTRACHLLTDAASGAPS
jgi:transposase